jgi:hypothetical protein
MTEKCTHVLAQTVAKKQRYLFNQNRTDQSTVKSVSQNTRNQDFKEDFKINRSLKFFIFGY